MEERIIMRVATPEEYAPGMYYEYVSDDLNDCIDQLAYLYCEVEEKGLSLEGCLFTISGRKDSYVFKSYLMDLWIKHGGVEIFLDGCRIPGSLVQRVEETLTSMGYEFKRLPTGGGSADKDEGFTIECPHAVSCYGLKFNSELYIHIYILADGSQSIEYGFKDLNAAAMRMDDCVKAIMENSNLGKTKAEKVWDSITDLIEVNNDAMTEIFGPVFEEKLMDVYIIDRNYTSNFLAAV